ncbi:hypothetical protein LBMAG42_52100 [Deltaproteobacteria bacterium]|nr:hypothetical protein LBMAG42_52100 [Deltaproteobacteria bacterium]
MLLYVLLLPGCPAGDDTADTAAVERCDESVPGTICTWAGQAQAGYNEEGLDRRDSWLYFPIDVELSEFGPPTILDWNNHRIRIVEEDDTLTTVMGTDFVGDGPPDLSDRTAPGALGTTVNLNHPTDVIYLPDGTMLHTSWHTHKIRRENMETGLVYVSAGAGSGFTGDGGDASLATFNQPKGAVYDEASGSTYIVDMRNERIRAIDGDNVINTVAGTGNKGFAGDGGDALLADFNFPKSTNPRPGGAIAMAGGMLYIADTENNRIRTVDLTTGIVQTVVGVGTAGFSGDGGQAAAAELNYPMDIEVEGGVLYIADTDNNRIRAVDLATGIITTVVGNGEVGDEGDEGLATDAQLYGPMGVEVDDFGAIYVADSYNHRIRRVAP